MCVVDIFIFIAQSELASVWGPSGFIWLGEVWRRFRWHAWVPGCPGARVPGGPDARVPGSVIAL
eukprot:8570518-Pyramimonas_sp.AAC.1